LTVAARPPVVSPAIPHLVLGIDPGTAVTGYGLVERTGQHVTLVECGVIRTSAGRPLPIRIRDIYEGIVELIERHRPSAVSIEDVFHGKNSRTALSLGHARGAIMLAAALKDLPIAEYTAVEIKKAVTGTGRCWTMKPT
jgi:crossover junction endodeoxyribonuclease RuvC